MPLFFFCSGIFFKNRCFKDTLVNNFRQLIFPYLFFLLILNCSYFIVNLYAGESIVLAFSNVVKEIDFLNVDSHLYLTIWFLPCLFIVKLLYAGIQKLHQGQILSLLCAGVGSM